MIHSATCEKQIPSASSSTLYCSESCRRKDHQRTAQPPSTNYPSNPSPPLTPLTTTSVPPPNLAPQRFSLASPTTAAYLPSPQPSSSSSSTSSSAAATSTHTPSSDRSATSTPRPKSFSAAADSLRKFQASTSTAPSSAAAAAATYYTTTNPSTTLTPHARNPSMPNLSSLTITPLTPFYPSTTTTPTSPTSSRARPPSSRSKSGSGTAPTTPIGSFSTSSRPGAAATEYGYNSYIYPSSTRPLPSRTPGVYSSSTPRSVELVTPHVPWLPGATAGDAGSGAGGNGGGVGKRSGNGNAGAGQSGLFAFREMRGGGRG
ncbi:MAG: hypothetical protein M1824_002712 [Vezdaea acicularis]|nr:MAG: hypothetical protein M1824_002712 [Vezdaea acicularis]